MRDDQAEADDDLGGGDGHHRDREDLAVLTAVQARERDQQQVGRVEHDLDREQDDQRVAAQHHAERADREEQRRRGRRTTGCQVRASPSDPSRACEPSTTPPTAATSSTIDVTSNAIRWSVRNSRPIDSGEPNARSMCFGCDEEAAGLEPDDDASPRRGSRRRRATAPTICHDGPPDQGDSSRAVAEVGDHEQEHHHHGAAVDQHLAGRDELAGEQQVEHGERREVPDQRERRVERVAEADDGERARQAGERGDEPDAPRRGSCATTKLCPCSTGSACRRGRRRRPARA